MHKTMKRLLSLLLALAMIASLSVTSVAALAEGRGVRQLATEELDPATLNVPSLGPAPQTSPPKRPSNLHRTTSFAYRSSSRPPRPWIDTPPGTWLRTPKRSNTATA